MLLFFEEDGAFKAGNILKKDGNAYQVELPTGRRVKAKGGHVFFEFDAPSAADFLDQVTSEAEQIDPQFLWEIAPDEEFDYLRIASEYFGEENARARAASLIALHSNPVFFYRKGRGNYKRAPEDILKRALEAVERKRQQEIHRKNMVEAMGRGELPSEIAANAMQLLTRPDKNSIEWKALNDASANARMSPLRLMLSLGGVRSPYVWHVEDFYAEHYPSGRNFPAAVSQVLGEYPELPTSSVHAFSIDDSQTTEIDDAVSLTDLDENRLQIGIHIAAPSLLVPRDSAIDMAARARMSTVYAPGLKTTMLPDAWVKVASLDEGKYSPCVSLYVVVDSTSMEVLSTETRLERVFVESNLRYDRFPVTLTDELMQSGGCDMPHFEDLRRLWHFARVRHADREAVRGRPEILGRVEWSFELEGEGEAAKVTLKPRRRGDPVDMIVSELMIFANMTWGLWLEEHNVVGIYRSQRMGRVRMSTSPGPHDGLGVLRYSWATSPLRRYVDLLNQRQIVCALMGVNPSYQPNDIDLFAIVSQFESQYEAYAEFEKRMKRYWSLRWIEQEGLREVCGVVVSDELVRFDGMPLMQRIPGLPLLERGRRVRFAVTGCDYIELVLETRLLEILDESEQLCDEDEDSDEAASAETDDAKSETNQLVQTQTQEG